MTHHFTNDPKAPIPEMLAGFIDEIIPKLRDQVRKGDVPPCTVLINYARPAVIPIPMPMANEKDKEVSSFVVRRAAEILEADAAVMITEAWSLPDSMSTMEIRDQRAKIYGPYLENDPARIDLLMLTVETRSGVWFVRAEITPAVGNHPRDFNEVTARKMHSASGRLTNFLSKAS